MLKFSLQYFSLCLLLILLVVGGMNLAKRQMEVTFFDKNIDASYPASFIQETMEERNNYYLLEDKWTNHLIDRKKVDLEETYNFYWLKYIFNQFTIFVESITYHLIEWLFV